MLELDAPADVPTGAAAEALVIAPSELDEALVAQLVVAWAGERQRLNWWASDMTDEFGGIDLLRRLTPRTAAWAALEGARLAARRHDAQRRKEAGSADDIVSLYRLGFERDERLDERLRELKLAGVPPRQALPALERVLGDPEAAFDRAAFVAWIEASGSVGTQTTPLGRRITGERPATLGGMVRRLVGALAPLGDTYPLPHWRGGA